MSIQRAPLASEEEMRSAPFPILLNFHFITHVQLQAFPEIFPSACLNVAGLQEPPKPNSDISWPTALVVRGKYSAGRGSLLSPLRGKPLLHWQALPIGKVLFGVCVLKGYSYHQQHLLHSRGFQFKNSILCRPILQASTRFCICVEN